MKPRESELSWSLPKGLPIKRALKVTKLSLTELPAGINADAGGGTAPPRLSRRLNSDAVCREKLNRKEFDALAEMSQFAPAVNVVVSAVVSKRDDKPAVLRELLRDGERLYLPNKERRLLKVWSIRALPASMLILFDQTPVNGDAFPSGETGAFGSGLG